jgi:hypothetical protein
VGLKGFPKEIVKTFAEVNDYEVFVETGTYLGQTSVWASTVFKKVFTIEKSEDLFYKSKKLFASISNIEPLLGDSATVLNNVLDQINSKKVIFWLDGHWSGDNTAGQEEECPLLGELAALKHRTDDIILIDDARLFLSTPPKPHNPDHWPHIGEIVYSLPYTNQNYNLQIIDDVIFIIPKSATKSQALLTNYAQREADLIWQRYLASC